MGAMPLKYLPRNPTRRGEAERRLEENRLLSIASRRPHNARRGGRGERGHALFRGGRRDNADFARGSVGPATGFLSGPTLEEAIASRRSRGGRGRGRGQGEVAARGRSDNVVGGESSTPAGSIRGGNKASKGKGKEAAAKEEDPEDDIGVYEGDAEDGGIDVDANAELRIVSDNEDGEGLSRQQGGLKYSRYGFNPVRVAREEHVKRAVGVNTEASSRTSAHIRQKAREAGVGARNMDVSAENGFVVPKAKSRKAKGKEKEVEYVSDKIAWRGVYSDDELEEPKIKEEEEDDDEQTMEAPSVAPQTQPWTQEREIVPDEVVVSEDDVVREEGSVREENARSEPSKVKKRRPSWRPYHFQEQQTEEDRREWMYMKEEMAYMRQMLRPVERRSDDDGEELEDDPRKDYIYLFQFPPVMPQLATPAEVAKLKEDHPQTSVGVEGQAGPSTKKGEGSKRKKAQARDKEPLEEIILDDGEGNVKVEEDSQEQESATEFARRYCFTGDTEANFQGQVGTLSVYENGSAVLDWGGIEFEVNTGVGSQLQEAVLIDGEHTEDRKAKAMSEVVDTLIATPNWEQLFGAAR